MSQYLFARIIEFIKALYPDENPVPLHEPRFVVNEKKYVLDAVDSTFVSSVGECNNMKYRAVIKKTGEWWIGWLIDLPGVNAQEKTKVKLIEPQKRAHSPQLAAGLASEYKNSKLPYGRRFPAACGGELQSLRIGAKDMLDTEVPFEPGAEMTTVDISDPVWTKSPIENLTVS